MLENLPQRRNGAKFREDPANLGVPLRPPVFAVDPVVYQSSTPGAPQQVQKIAVHDPLAISFGITTLF